MKQTTYEEGRRLELIGEENTEQRRVATACKRTMWSRGKGVKTDRRIASSFDARAMATDTTLKCIINKCNAFESC